MAFCKVSLWTKSYDVTIQMKALFLYLHRVLFVLKMLQNVILKSGGNLPLATFSSERVKGIKGGCIDGTVLRILV